MVSDGRTVSALKDQHKDSQDSGREPFGEDEERTKEMSACFVTTPEQTACLGCPLKIQLLPVQSAIPEIKVDQVLIWHTQFSGN
jgi:hypothetical protein